MSGAATGSYPPLPPDLAEAGPEPASTELAASTRALQTADFGSLDVTGQAETLFATLDGAPVAVLPLALYRRLVAAAVRPAAGPTAAAPKPVPVDFSTIERDEEVAAFLRERFRHGSATHAVLQACVDRFG